MPCYSLTKVKHSPSLSEETPAFTAVLVCDGVTVAHVSNHGTGGCNDIRYTTREAEAAFAAFVATVPSVECEGVTLTMDEDIYIGRLLDDALTVQKFRRLMSKNILARVADSVYKYKVTGSHVMLAANVKTKHPNAIILNGMDDTALVAALEGVN